MATEQVDNVYDDDSSPMINPDILNSNLLVFVKELQLRDILPALKPILPTWFIEEIYAENNEQEKKRKLILHIKRLAKAEPKKPKQYKLMNSFFRILAGTQPKLFNKIVKRSPTEPEINFCVQDFMIEKKKCIKNEKKHRTECETDLGIDLDYEHVTLSIVSKEDNPRKHDEQLPHEYGNEMMEVRSDRSVSSSTLRVEDILHPHKRNPKSIIVFGRAGMGKTTTIQWLARQWAFDRWAPQFTLLFILQIRSLTVSDCSTTCVQLLKNNALFVLEEKENELLTASWLRNYADRIIIMIDGLDEVLAFNTKLSAVREIVDIEMPASPLELCLNLLNGNLLKGCTLLATSRPFPGLRKQKFDSRLEILGLSPSGILEYVSKLFKEKADRIIFLLKENPVLMSVCAITWYCMQISKILASGEFVTEFDTDINTYTRLNAFIVVELIKRKRGQFLLEVKPYFRQLAELAYKGIFAKSGSTKIVFNDDDINNIEITKEDLEKARTSGILQVQTAKKGRREDLHAEFIHLSVQELLAATHFLLHTNKLKEDLECIFGGGQFNMACMYMFGVCYDRKSDWIKDIRCGVNKDTEKDADMEAFDHDVSEFLKNRCKSQEIDLILCQLVNEGKNPAHAQIVANAVVPSKCLSITRTKMTAIDFMALGFVCEYVKCLEKITLKEVTADKTSLKLMSSSILKKHREKLVTLDISGNKFGDAGVSAITEELHESQLQVLNLDENNITYQGIKELCVPLKSNDKLKHLLINENDIGDEGAEILSEYLIHNAHKSITLLDICSNLIGEKGAKAIGVALSKNKCLKHLNISDNPLDKLGVEAIADGLAHHEHLEALNMSHVAQGSHVGKNIAKALRLNKSLEDLYINRNNIGCVGAKAIGDAMLSHPNLKRLEIANNNIRDQGAKGLAVGLKKANLKLLSISGNKMTPDGFREINIALDGKDCHLVKSFC